MKTITYDKKALPFILDSLQLKTDSDGYIIDSAGGHVPSSLGDPKVHSDRLAGFIKTDKGMRLVMDDICSLIKMADDEACIPVPVEPGQ